MAKLSYRVIKALESDGQFITTGKIQLNFNVCIYRQSPIFSLVTKAYFSLYPSGIPRRHPPSCEDPREPTIYIGMYKRTS